MNRSPVAALVRGWVDLYTRGMRADVRAARRDELDDDLWCQHEEAAAIGRSARSHDADLILRLVFGMPADISWRVTYRVNTAPPSLERSSSMNTRTLGVLAIVAGLTWGTLFVLFIPLSEGLWLGPFGLVGMTGSIVGAIAFSAAAIGLARRFQDYISLLGAIGAMLVVLGAVSSVVGAILSIVALTVGSAMLMQDLARIGVVPRLVPIVHVATALVFTVALLLGQLGFRETGSRVLVVAVLIPYLLTWVAIGVSLFRGGRHAQATSA
jgi:hypothetical protein